MGQSSNGNGRRTRDWMPPRIRDAVVAERPDPLAVRSLRIGLLLRVEAHGQLDAQTVVQLTSALQVSDGVNSVLVDLTGARLLDRAAAEAVVAAHERLDWDGKRLAILCPPGDVRTALERAGVTDVVPAFVDPDAAIDAIAGRS